MSGREKRGREMGGEREERNSENGLRERETGLISPH